MKKIPTIYQRDPATKLRYVKNEPHPDCDWVFAGEGTPTYKWDGTAVMIDETYAALKRREVKPGKRPPEGFRQEGAQDPVTDKLVGWVPANRNNPEDVWLWEAVDNWHNDDTSGNWLIPPGTYELVGPKVQGNPHQLHRHLLIRHGVQRFVMVPTGFDDLAQWLRINANAGDGFEGVVWHNPDGRMAKIKAKDFPRP